MLITLPFFDHFALLRTVDSRVRTVTMPMPMNRGPSEIEFNPATGKQGTSRPRLAECDDGRQRRVKAGKRALTQRRRPCERLRVGADGGGVGSGQGVAGQQYANNMPRSTGGNGEYP
jgi:hypothetical protein